MVSIQHAGLNGNNLKDIKYVTKLITNFNESVIHMKCKLVSEEAGGLATYNVVHPLTSF